MRSTTILVLPGLAAALDIGLYFNDTCNNKGTGYVYCSNFDPGQCCSSSALTFRSVGLHGIPPVWNVEGGLYTSLNCQGAFARERSEGRTDICMKAQGTNWAKSGGYVFVNSSKKDMKDNAFTVIAGADKDKKKCNRPDTVVLSDGTEFDIAQLDEVAYAEMEILSLAAADITTAELSDKFVALKK
ncbi:hypothetical protein MN608_11674 [Microdochium nivale]|nr:hypothetical protein MN608_11674 [Microdochium nivale]